MPRGTIVTERNNEEERDLLPDPPAEEQAEDRAAGDTAAGVHDRETQAEASGADAEAEAAADDRDAADVEDLDDADLDADDESAARRPRLAMIAVGVLVAALLGIGAGLLVTRFLGPPSPDQVVARVGDVEITRLDFVRNYRPGDDPQTLMDQLIDIELVIQEARAADVTVDPAEVDAQIEQIKAQHGGDEEAYMAFLNSAGVASEADLRSLLERQQLIEAMILEHTQLEQVRSRHILLGAADEDELAEREEEAEALMEELANGSDFAELAAANSDDPGSAEQGGDLGWVPRGVFVPEFEEAIFSMQPGEVRLVESQFGWHIIEVLEGPSLRPAEDQQLLQSPAGQLAFEETFLPWVDELRNEAQQADEIAVLVEPEQLVPTPAPLATPATPEDE